MIRVGFGMGIYYFVLDPVREIPCSSAQEMRIYNGKTISQWNKFYRAGITNSLERCFSDCLADNSCVASVYSSSSGNCYLLNTAQGLGVSRDDVDPKWTSAVRCNRAAFATPHDATWQRSFSTGAMTLFAMPAGSET